MRFHDPEVVRILAAAEQARERLADAIAGQPPERSDRAAQHATDAILALIPRFTDPNSGEEGSP